jgi:predicted kinase
MSGRWVKIYEKFSEWEWYGDASCKIVFLDLLLHANFKSKKYQGVEVPEGACVTGYESLAKRVGLSVQQVRTAFKKLKSTGELTVKQHPKFSIVSITNWEKYQGSNSQSTAEQQASNRRATAPLEGKKERKIERGDTLVASATEVEAEPEPDLVSLAFEDWEQVAKACNLPVPRKITDKRRKAMKARIKDEGLDGWREMLRKVAASSFLKGQNNSGWSADIDFVLNPANFNKIMEGKYDDRTGSVGTNSASSISKHPMAQAFDELRERCGGYGPSGNPFHESTADDERGQVIELEAIGRRYSN